MGKCTILNSSYGAGKYSGAVIWGTPIKIISQAPAGADRWNCNMYLSKSINYPFYKITGTSSAHADRTQGDTSWNITDGYIGVQTKNTTQYAARGWSAGQTSLPFSHTSSDGHIYACYQTINEEWTFYYGGEVNYVYIDHSPEIENSFFDKLTSFYINN